MKLYKWEIAAHVLTIKDSAREHNLNPLQNIRPVAFRKRLESEEALQSEPPVFQILHPNAGAPCCSRTPQDMSLSSRILASDDSIAQLCGDRDEIEGRASAVHCDARDCHDIQGIETSTLALAIVELKGRYSIRDNLRPWVSPVGEDLVLNEHKEDKARSMDKAHACLGNTIGFATNGERNDEPR